jgi:hypothetical protein
MKKAKRKEVSVWGLRMLAKGECWALQTPIQRILVTNKGEILVL